MTLPFLLFVCFAFTSVAGAIALLVLRNIFHAALGLLVSLLSIAALFAFAGADFLAVAQIVIYVGGILVLLIFGIMLVQKQQKKALVVGHRHKLLGSILAISFAAPFFFLILKTDFDTPTFSAKKPETLPATTEKIGLQLMTDYVYALEIAGLLLLLALIAATFIAAKVKKH